MGQEITCFRYMAMAIGLGRGAPAAKGSIIPCNNRSMWDAVRAKRDPVDANNNVPVLEILFRQQWDLTKVGDWQQWTKSQQGEQDVIETREHNDLHSLTSRNIDQDPAKNLAYDANGSQIDDGETFLFEYDANDQLKTVRNRATNAVVVEYRYDVFGRRIEKDVKAGNPKGAPVGITRYYYIDQQIAEECDANDVVQGYYTYGDYIDEPLTMDRKNGETFVRHYYHQNRMFSTYVLTDGQGAVVERYAYTAYGERKIYNANYADESPVSRVGNPFTFTGRELDRETVLMNYRARTYDPVTGRFKQLDTISPSPGTSLYEYTTGRPTLYLDPSGRVVIVIHGVESDGDWTSDIEKGLKESWKDEGNTEQDVLKFTWGKGGNPDWHEASDQVSGLGDEGEEAKNRLISFVGELRKLLDEHGCPKEPISVIAHSQGTIITLAALQEGMKLNNFVSLGSPLDGEHGVMDVAKAGPSADHIYNYWSSNDGWAGLKGGAKAWDNSYTHQRNHGFLWLKTTLTNYSLPANVTQTDLSKEVSKHTAFQTSELAKKYYGKNVATKDPCGDRNNVEFKKGYDEVKKKLVRPSK